MNSKQSRRRILFLLPFAPRLNGTHGGSRTTAALIARMAQRHSVAILYLRAPDEPAIDDVLRSRCELVEEVEQSFNTSFRDLWVRRARLLMALLRGKKPAWCSNWASRKYGRRVRALAQSWKPDVVQMEFHLMGQYSPYLDGLPIVRVLTQHEPGTAAAQELITSGSRLRRILARLDFRAWKAYETTVMGQVQSVVVFTDRDRRVLAPLAQQTPIVVIPLGTELPETSLNPQGESPPSLLFVGNFVHPPNRDAAIRLVQRIFPMVQARHPSTMLYVVGGNPPSEITERFEPNVVVTGLVPDVTPYLNRAALVVVPLRHGGGMRVKVLEALAAGKALIASPLAVEGLDLTEGEQVVIADTDEQFQTAILQLLHDPISRLALACRARAWACENLNWDNRVTAYEAVYDTVTNGPTPDRSRSLISDSCAISTSAEFFQPPLSDNGETQPVTSV